jgi:nickel-dependent lactate racemase
MKDLILKSVKPEGISDDDLKRALETILKNNKRDLKKVLLIPPDFTRLYSGAGKIVEYYYGMLKETCQVEILPAVGTHEPMNEQEIKAFFGEEVPIECVLVHNWRKDVVKIGEVPREFVEEASEGLLKNKIDVEINKRLLDKSYDLIISIGQVVPHEVVGMANYSKNIFVGCGGSNMINQSHMLGAFYGAERIMGKDFSPVRKVFDYAEENFIQDIPLIYVLTVTTNTGHHTNIHGLFAGRNRRIFEDAVSLSQEKNITFVDRPLKKVVAFLDEREFKTTWVGNKSIYRSRMAIADGGELIVLAAGIRKFGEDKGNDEIIRKFGYVGRKNVLKLVKNNEDLQNNLSAAAHLIHGSSDGLFSITYAVKNISKEEIESVGFQYMPYEEAVCKYDPEKLKDGYNTLEDGEEIYFISNPALGLWASKDRF